VPFLQLLWLGMLDISRDPTIHGPKFFFIHRIATPLHPVFAYMNCTNPAELRHASEETKLGPSGSVTACRPMPPPTLLRHVCKVSIWRSECEDLWARSSVKKTVYSIPKCPVKFKFLFKWNANAWNTSGRFYFFLTDNHSIRKSSKLHACEHHYTGE